MTASGARDEVILTTCPRDCYDTCGMQVLRRDGVVTAVRGNPAHPVSRGTLCGKCSTGYNREWRDPARRLLQPLRRVGAKGAGNFEAISWETALEEIAGRLTDTIAAHGAHTILNAHYTGTISLLAGTAPMRFFNRVGATEVTPDTICNMAGHVALRYLYGSSLDGFDPRTARDAACIVVWGANPHASAPHAHEHWLPEARGTVVVVDPIRTPTALQADIHLQPFPGSDAALAFSLLHVIRREGLIDLDFIAAHVQGWEELEPTLAACNPAWGSAVTGVPAKLIEEVAVLYARGPSLLWMGQGLQRQATGGNVMRACGLLPAVTGNLGKPGAGFLYLNGTLRERRLDEEYLAGSHPEPDGGAPSISHMDFAAAMEDSARSRALFVWNMNPLASCPQQARLRQALRREDLLTVALDLFATDTTQLADYVLPAASFLEFDDLIASYFHLTLSAQVKVMEPLGSALPNQEIFRRLARAMNFGEAELQEGDGDILRTLLERNGSGLTFADLAARGSVWVPEVPAVQFADGIFSTQSGRIEIASPQAEADGHPRIPQPWSDARPAAGKLRLLSPAHPWLMNTSFGNVRKIENRIGEATIALHPDDAADRLLAQGDCAMVRNGCGQLRLKVVISLELPRGVALAHKGRWLHADAADPRIGGAHGPAIHANVNALNAGIKSDMGESTAVHSVEVTVAALDGPLTFSSRVRPREAWTEALPGYWDLVLYGLAYIAPFAPLSTLGFVWSESNGLIVLAYLLGAVCMYFTAQSYATMTESLPTAGSVYGFARHSLGAFPGFIAGWMILLDYLLIPAFVYVLIAVALETLLPGIDRGLWIVLMVAMTTAVNWFGITVTSRANFISVGAQVIIMAGFLALGIIALYAGKGNGALTFKPVFDAAAFDSGKIFSATSICIMSFLGFDAVSTLAEEVEGGDRRVVGRAIIAVLVLSAIFFVAVTWVLGNLLPGIAIKDQAAAVYELAAWATGPWTAVVLAWAYAGIVGLSNALPMQVGVARVVFAMGRDRQLPRFLARVHPRYHTPYMGMLVTATLSLAVALYMKNRLDDLASIVNFGALSGFLFLHISVLAYFGVRRKSRSFIRHWVVPLCGIIVVLAVFSGMSALAVKVGVSWLALGLAYGLVLKAKHREELHVPL